ncbi:MAG: hypothetical protein IKZ62_06835 [Prevotella sp.]|nr:hypothetical protein [Prevotella sp.]
MKKTIALFVLMLLIVSCGHKKPRKNDIAEPISTQQNLPGDSTLYGLACDGSTDSILVFLPYSGVNPDTFDIINAFQEHHIYGRPHIGDELAVILNPEDKAEVLMIVNIEALKGQWCYQVMPTFKHIDKMPQKMQRRMMERIPDSVKQKMIVPREYGFRLKRGYSAQAIGGRQRRTSTDDMSPVEYPRLRRYAEWRLYNGRLILTTDSIRIPNSSKRGKPEQDTADIVYLRRDTLILKFKDHEQKYYRKAEQEEL